MLSQTQVLLVAGPSGAGKSTLIDLLSRGGLPDDIRRELPEGASSWPLFHGKHLRKSGQSGALTAQLGEGFVAHYDTTYIIRAGLDRYEQDPAVTLFRLCASLVVLNIKPDDERLRSQLAGRIARRRGSRSQLHDLWVRFVRAPFKRAKENFAGNDNLSAPLDFYCDSAQLSQYYEAWDRYIRSLIEDKPRARILHVEPQTAYDGSPSFRLVEIIEA